MTGITEFLDIFGKFGLAVLLAGILGLERQLKGRAAGLRTHVLVCLGSTLAMIVSDYVALQWGQGGAPIWLDRGRIAAGIITGVGFLGAGAIMTVANEQRGLTTAAMLWFVAALGIAIGLGYYMLAICATCFAYAVVRGMKYLERYIPAYESYFLTVRLPRGLERMDELECAVRNVGFNVATLRIKMTANDEQADIVLEIHATAGPNVGELARMIRARFPEAEKITFER